MVTNICVNHHTNLGNAVVADSGFRVSKQLPIKGTLVFKDIPQHTRGSEQWTHHEVVDCTYHLHSLSWLQAVFVICEQSFCATTFPHHKNITSSTTIAKRYLFIRKTKGLKN